MYIYNLCLNIFRRVEFQKIKNKKRTGEVVLDIIRIMTFFRAIRKLKIRNYVVSPPTTVRIIIHPRQLRAIYNYAINILFCNRDIMSIFIIVLRLFGYGTNLRRNTRITLYVIFTIKQYNIHFVVTFSHVRALTINSKHSDHAQDVLRNGE